MTAATHNVPPTDALDLALTGAELRIYLSTAGMIEHALELERAADAARLVSRARRARLLRSDALSRRGRIEEALRIQLAVLADAEHDGDRMISARAHCLLASSYDRLAELPKAQAAAEAGVHLLAPGDPPCWHAEHLMVLALLTSWRRHGTVDFTTFDESVRRARELGDDLLLLAILNNYAYLLLESSDERGIELTDEMQAIVGRALDGWAPSAWLDTIAVGQLAAGRLDEASSTAQAAIAAAPTDMVEPGCVAGCVLTAASIERARGDMVAARARASEALRLAQGAGAGETASGALKMLSELAAIQGDYRTAYETLRRHVEEWSRHQTERAERHAATIQAIYGAETERRRREAVERIADTDPLTGLWNRRFLNRRLAELSGGRVALALLDIDHFKQVNDRFSHDAGDAVLCRVADALRRACEADPPAADGFAARVGGEEFVIVLPDPNRAEVLALCERVRAGVSAAEWGACAPGLRLTASIGVAIDETGATSPSELLSEADAQLYGAKRQGRDRVLAS